MPASETKMRWHNPKLGVYEWREVPGSDKEALELLAGYQGHERHAEIYREWREAGATITAALIRAGESIELGPPPERP